MKALADDYDTLFSSLYATSIELIADSVGLRSQNAHLFYVVAHGVCEMF